jgi:hypothetical protein
MLSAARRAARFLTVLAVMMSLVSTLFASAHPLLETDRDCGPLTIGHGVAPAAWQAVPPRSTDDHCAFCHWLRAVGGASPSGVVAASPVTLTSAIRRMTDDASVRTAAVERRSSRAPPRAFTTV